MTDERWRSIAIVLAIVLALLVVLVLVTSGPAGPSNPTARPSASASASSALGSPSASSEASASPSAAESPSASTSANPSATPSTPNAGVAQVTFSGFKLDAASDPDGKARTFTFKTDGAGNVHAKLATRSPQGTTKFCLKVGATAPLCRNWRSGDLTGTTSAKGQTTFVVTLIGVGIATPTVDVSLSFRAAKPSVTLTNGRFDGTTADGYNGLAGKVKVRSVGTITVNATWAEATDYQWSYVDLTDATNTGVFPGNGTGIDRTDTVAPSRSYAFSLVNSSAGTGRVPLTMTLAWR